MDWLFGNITDITEEQYKEIFETLSDSRKARIIRIKKEDDRRRSLMATHLVYTLLKKLGYEKVTLENSKNGKPYLKGCDLSVSISHSGNGVVCALSEKEIGIDIEAIRPIRKGLVEYVCNKQEREYINLDSKETENEITEAAVLKRFYTVWTAKEAYFKKGIPSVKDIRSIDTFSFDKQVFYIDEFVITVV